MRFDLLIYFALILGSVTPSIGFAKEVHFVIFGSELHILSSNPQELQDECMKLQIYAEQYSKKNHRPFSVDPLRCTTHRIFDLKRIQSEIIIPDYSRSDATKTRIGKMSENPVFSLLLSPWFPREIWTRYQDRPQDGVCYNTALVESGILAESDRSSFITTAEYFLGMQGLQKAAVEGDEMQFSYGPKSDSPLIASRKTWEIEANNRELVKRDIQKHLEDHFSPGSILCISIDPRETKRNLPDVLSYFQASFPNMRFRTNIETLPVDYLTERQGGHCLVFLTPDLISESNLRLPKNLVNWDIAFDYYFDLIRKMSGEGRFHYFQIKTPEALSGRWIQQQFQSSKRLQKLVNLAKRHRELYESLPWSPCPGSGGQINLYSDMCATANAKAQLKLKEFWKNADTEIFDHPDFADFRRRLQSENEKGFESNADSAAFEIFGNMWSTRSRF